MVKKCFCILALMFVMILSMSVTAFGGPGGGKHPPPTIPPRAFSICIPSTMSICDDYMETLDE